ncbi:MAG: hypothetical protein GXP24_11400, partial [Planctomycetes bacterium]|nr:hypothetical protein [Planctomycetota bacterium]
DLQPKANQRLKDDFLPGHYPGDNLSEMTQGVNLLGGGTFLIGDSLIEVAGKFLPNHPQRVEGIEIGRYAKSIRILHGARWGAFGGQGDGLGHWVADGTPIGYYEINYADAETVAVPIVYGVDVRDWWSIWDDSKPVRRGKVVWTGTNPHLRGRSEARHTAKPLRLYMMTWKNPRPESLITSINLVSLNQTSTPFCVAITVEESHQQYENEFRKLRKRFEQLRADFEKLQAKIDDINY